MNVVYHLKSSDRLRQKKDPDSDQATAKSDFGMAKCNVTRWVSVVYVTWGVCVLHFVGNYNGSIVLRWYSSGVCVLHFVGNYNWKFHQNYKTYGVCVLHFVGNYNTMDEADLWLLGVCVLHFVGNYNLATTTRQLQLCNYNLLFTTI